MSFLSRIHSIKNGNEYVQAITCCMFAVSLLVFPLTASAYKVGTHVWVAQQVLNDLDDGKVTIPLGGVNYELAVDPKLAHTSSPPNF